MLSYIFITIINFNILAIYFTINKITYFCENISFKISNNKLWISNIVKIWKSKKITLPLEPIHLYKNL